jgi:Asp-tRNA(Asn)/Glu-tRNA(Gln) amidotransferase C subunit
VPPDDTGPRVLELVVRHGSCTAEPEQGSAGCIEPVAWGGGRLTQEIVTALASDVRSGLSIPLALQRRKVPRSAYTRWVQRGVGQLARAAEEERDTVDTVEALLVLEIEAAEAERFGHHLEQLLAVADPALRFKILSRMQPDWGFPTTRHVYREEKPNGAPKRTSGAQALEAVLRRLDHSNALDVDDEEPGDDGG